MGETGKKIERQRERETDRQAHREIMHVLNANNFTILTFSD